MRKLQIRVDAQKTNEKPMRNILGMNNSPGITFKAITHIAKITNEVSGISRHRLRILRLLLMLNLLFIGQLYERKPADMPMEYNHFQGRITSKKIIENKCKTYKKGLDRLGILDYNLIG